MVDSESNSLESSAQSDAVDAETTINRSRRRLTGAGVGVSAIFTLASRPVLAIQCAAASSAASGNLSQHGTPPQCVGRTPDFWIASQHQTEWPSPYQQGSSSSTTSAFGSADSASSPSSWSGGTAFHPEFYGTKFMANNKSLTMNQVMLMKGGSYLNCTDNDALGAHIAAALLNAMSGKTPGVLTVEKVKTMWSECQIKGFFEPIAGVKWLPAKVVAYLKTTMI
ncbi:MAG: hypothetical protein ACYC4K_09995 [Thiobacillus sp.]